MAASCAKCKSFGVRVSKRATQEGIGCILLLVGLLLTPALIGIPLVLYAIGLMGRLECRMECTKCGWQSLPYDEDHWFIRFAYGLFLALAAAMLFSMLGFRQGWFEPRESEPEMSIEQRRRAEEIKAREAAERVRLAELAKRVRARVLAVAEKARAPVEDMEYAAARLVLMGEKALALTDDEIRREIERSIDQRLKGR